MHKLLCRQLKKIGIDEPVVPTPSQWAVFLSRINQSYDAADQDRYTLERSLEISSSEMHQLYRKLKESSEARQHSILNAIPDLLFLLDEDGLYIEILANETPDLLVASKNNLLGHYIQEALPQDLSKRFLAIIKQALKTNQLQKTQYSLDVGRGLRHFEGRMIKTGQEVNGKETILFLARDITEVLEAESQQKLLSTVMASAREGLVIVRHDKKVMYANQAMAQITGISVETLIKEGAGFLRHEKDIELCLEICRLAHEKDHLQKEITIHIGDKYEILVLLNLTTVRNESGDIEHFVGVLTDMTEIEESKKQLHFNASHDALTGLPNRQMFEDRFHQTLARAKRTNIFGALLFLDLDNFKNVNDSLGHGAGDTLLIEIANRLSSLCREVDTVARFGGDEFIIILEDIGNTVHLFSFLDKLFLEFGHKITIQGYELDVSVSVGVTIFPEHGNDIEQLVKQADAAMYVAKRAGKNRSHIFSAELLETTMAGFTLDIELRQAIENNEFYLVYQPQFSLQSGDVTGFEALIRWQHPVKGLISPAQFIPAAEATGLIDQIGIWVFETVCQQVVIWSDAQLPFKKIAFNLSQRQLVDENLFENMMQILIDTNALKHIESIECEITESAIFDNADHAYNNLLQLSEAGMSLSIDDFGTGHSSLINLKRFPLNRLKIDQTFVADVGKDASDEAIIEATIALAKSFGLKVVAEGVETKEQEQFLKRINCEDAQGFLYSQPLAVVDVEALLSHK